MIKYYSITKDDKFRLANAAEKIYLKRAELIGKTITWELLTTKWLWFDLPETELDRNVWVPARRTWMKALNAEFRKMKRAVRLYNVFGHGVKLEEQGSMSHKSTMKGVRKVTNVFHNTIDDIDGILGSDPEGKRILKIMKMIYRRNLIYLHGEIQLSSLPGGVKRDIVKMIKENLPLDEEQLEIA